MKEPCVFLILFRKQKEHTIALFAINRDVEKKKSNLVQHLLMKHKEEYEEHIANQIDPIAAQEMQLKLLQCMVEKVTINGRPFASLNDSGYIKSIDDKLNALAKAGFGIKLNDKKYAQVKKLISETTNKIREFIKEEAKQQLISLMLDIATKNNKSILGINLRYIIDGKMVERCIGMIPLDEQHTSKNIAIQLKKCIDKFGLALQQVKSITTDNARNVIGVVDYLDEAMLSTIEEEEVEEEEEPSITTEPNELNLNQNFDDLVTENEIRTIALQIMQDEALEEYLDDGAEYVDLLKRVIADLPHHFNENTVNVRCGCHVVHLMVRGAIKKSNICELVTVCRKVAKLLRQEAIMREARKRNLVYKMPHLNVETRWDSDFTMVIVFFVALFI